MGRNTPSLRRKIDTLRADVEKLANFLRDKEVKHAVYEIIDLWYRESGALSASNNPLIYFDLLFLVIAQIWARLNELESEVKQMYVKEKNYASKRSNS